MMALEGFTITMTAATCAWFIETDDDDAVTYEPAASGVIG